MSQYEKLPVYKKALDMKVYFEKVVQGFSRYQKYTLGSELRDLAHGVLLAVAMANRKAERIRRLEEAISKLEEMKITVHVCAEVGAYHSMKSVGVSVSMIVEVSRQCEGWLKKERQNLAGMKPAGVRADS